MPRMLVFHNGSKFRAETNLMRGSIFVVCKCSGRSFYVQGEQAHKLHEALHTGWERFGINADGDDVWQWIWLNCGFYRLAGAS